MCGVTGIFNRDRCFTAANLESWATAASDRLRHRGPDGDGVWVDAAQGIALGHRRLAIMDLSSAGRQPMQSNCGRFVLAVNGEIYNDRELRKELAGYEFTSSSDSEAMLAAISRWGVSAAVERFVGQFAFAVWDRHEQRLVIGRDRLGEKPLYYAWFGKSFVFASELKALATYPGCPREVDRDALAAFLRFSYIPAPNSIWKGVYKLPAGSILSLTDDSASNATPRRYWSLADVAHSGMAEARLATTSSSKEQLDNALRESVRLQMRADAPVGALLSGGIDSSTVVAMMQSLSDQPVKTFTIGFADKGFNEARYAKAVATHLGTDHTELYVTAQEICDVVHKLPRIYDEPFSDSSQIPTYLLARLAKRQVSVVLSGDGADELFGGYVHHRAVPRHWSRLRSLPVNLRRGLAHMLKFLSAHVPERGLAWMSPVLPWTGGGSRACERMYQLAHLLPSRTLDEAFLATCSEWKDESEVLCGSSKAPVPVRPSQFEGGCDISKLLYCDAMAYLPDDILVKVDRATMAVALESRAPFLDHRVVELSWRLPLEHKIRDGVSKWLLRQVLYQYVPPALVDRPKMGFGLPLDDLLRGELRDWAEALLDEHRLRQEEYFRPRLIRQRWQEHLSGRRCNWGGPLWSVLMFQAWLETQ